MAERHVHTYNRRSVKVITRRAALPGACFVIAAYAGFTALRQAGVITGVSGDLVALAALTLVLTAFVVRLVPQHRAYEVGFREGENFGANVRTLRRWSRWRCAGQGVVFLIAFGLLGVSASLLVGLTFRDSAAESEAARYRQRPPSFTVPPTTVSASPSTRTVPPSKPATTTTHATATKTEAAEQSPRPTSAPTAPTTPEPSGSPPSPSGSPPSPSSSPPQETGTSSPPASPDGPRPGDPVRTLLRRLGSLI